MNLGQALQPTQTPQDWWRLTLLLFAWSVRIVLSCLVLFAVCCAAIIAFLVIYRITAWIVPLLV